METKEIKLGQKIRDTITGLEGVAVGRTTYLYGCVRVTMQPYEVKDGKPAEWCSFDEPQLEVLGDTDKVAVAEERAKVPTHGPQPDVARGR